MPINRRAGSPTLAGPAQPMTGEFGRSSRGFGAFSVAAVVLAGLVAADAAVRLAGVAGNTNILQGDVLAPFSMFDQFRVGEAVDLSRQPWVLPWLAARLWHLVGGASDFHSLLVFYSDFTALAVSLTLPLVFLLARRVVGDIEALAATALVACNGSLYLASVYVNPTLVLGFCLTAVTLCLAELDRHPKTMACLAAAAGAVGFLARWEGALLLVLANAALLWRARRGVVPLRLILGLAALSLLLMLGIGLAHVLGSSTPFAFLHNTNAVAPAWSILQDSPSEQLRILIRAIGWKLEKLNAFSADLTFIGVVLAAVGAVYAVPRLPSLAFPLVYWVGYEFVMLLFTLAVPVGDSRYLRFFNVFSTAPVDRYYQIFTPMAMIFVYCGIRYVAVASKRSLDLPVLRSLLRAIVVSFVAIFLVLYPAYTAWQSYAAEDWPTSRTGLAADFIRTADFFRANRLRGRDIDIVKQGRHGLDYIDTFPSTVAGYALTVFHFSILSGHNRVNCTGYDLDNPNLFCSVLFHSNTFNPASAPQPDYLVLLKPLTPASIPTEFRLLYQNASFAVFGRR